MATSAFMWTPQHAGWWNKAAYDFISHGFQLFTAHAFGGVLASYVP